MVGSREIKIQDGELVRIVLLLPDLTDGHGRGHRVDLCSGRVFAKEMSIDENKLLGKESNSAVVNMYKERKALTSNHSRSQNKGCLYHV
jgi:hypothetical protein